MRRVVVTGLGIVSSIGNNAQEVLASLREAKSGIVKADDYARLGFRCQVHGAPTLDLDSAVDRRVRRFMGDGAAWNYVAMQQAIVDSGLEENDVKNERTGLIMGSGGPSTQHHRGRRRRDARKRPEAGRPLRGAGRHVEHQFGDARHALRHQRRQLFDLVGLRDLGALHRQCRRDDPVGQAGRDVRGRRRGTRLDACRCLFDAMGAMSSKFNATPDKASRAYDKNRDGFVIAGGAGTVVLEELEHAKARGAKIYAEIVGYGATSDGYDMVQPSGEGAARCMRLALPTVKEKIDYINPHATSTPIGDKKEIEAIREVFGKDIPPISATKSLTGHSLGATGVQEAIYCILMMKNGFICESANIEELDPEFADIPIVRERRDNVRHRCRDVQQLRFRRHQRDAPCTLIVQRLLIDG